MPDAHDAQVDGVEGQLGQNTGQDGGDAAGGVEQTRDQSGQHTRQHAPPAAPARGSQPVLTHQQHAHRAAGSQGAVHRQIGHIQDLIGDIDADGHNAPDQALGRRRRAWS